MIKIDKKLAEEVIVNARLLLIVNKNLSRIEAIKNAIVIPDSNKGFVENILSLNIEAKT